METLSPLRAFTMSIWLGGAIPSLMQSLQDFASGSAKPFRDGVGVYTSSDPSIGIALVFPSPVIPILNELAARALLATGRQFFGATLNSPTPALALKGPGYTAMPSLRLFCAESYGTTSPAARLPAPHFVVALFRPAAPVIDQYA